MPSSKNDLLRRAKRVKLIAMDADGVLTNGDIVVLNSGEEVKVWNSKDRLVLALIRDLKTPLSLAWITGRASEAVTRAAADLGIPHVVQKCHNKRQALEKILSSLNLTFDDAAFIGDDVIDLPVLNAVGFSACPSDATADILKKAHYISPVAGGRGAVREIMEFILKAQGRWKTMLTFFPD